VIALYFRVSRGGPWLLGGAIVVLGVALPPETGVVFGRAAGRADERIAVVRLAEAEAGMADMATCVIVGSAATRTVGRGGLPPLVYTPRFAARAAR
jgi:precorrin-3B C17-methyltransferase